MSRKLLVRGQTKLERQLPLNRHVRQKSEQGQDFSKYANNPLEFAYDVLKISFLTDDQQRILLSVRDNPETNCPSCHGQGKTFLGAVCCLYFVFAVGGLCITSAPTQRQVAELLWSEIRKIYDSNQTKLGGERGQLFLKLSETARAYGFSSKDYDSNSMAGIHAEKLLVILDEACGVSAAVDDGAVACCTGSLNRILRIGNPITGGGSFEAACKRSSIRLPAWNHPNLKPHYQQDPDGIHRLKPEVKLAVTAEDGSILPQHLWADWVQKDVISGAISVFWVEKIRATRGEDSVFWQSRVEAFFPRDAKDAIIPRSWFLAARARYDANPRYWDTVALQHTWRHGVDPGDGGDDHGLASWRGPVLYFADFIPGKDDREDITRIAGLTKKKVERMGGTSSGTVAVDRIGCGSGVLAILLEQSVNAIGVHWAEKAKDSTQFQNLKAEQFWKLREAFQSGEIAIAPLRDQETEQLLLDELSSIYFDYTSTGKIRIEPKEKTKSRLGHSPNVADSVVMSFSLPGNILSASHSFVLNTESEDIDFGNGNDLSVAEVNRWFVT